MTPRVFKYDIAVGDEVLVEMPAGAQILYIGRQVPVEDTFCLWARVDPGEPTVQRLIKIRGTGHSTPSSAPYIGTVQDLGTTLVWHVFDGGEQQ